MRAQRRRPGRNLLVPLHTHYDGLLRCPLCEEGWDEHEQAQAEAYMARFVNTVQADPRWQVFPVPSVAAAAFPATPTERTPWSLKRPRRHIFPLKAYLSAGSRCPECLAASRAAGVSS